MSTQAEKRIAELTSELTEHAYRYYVLDDPIISDGEYDQLFHELLSLEEAFPHLAADDSPTRRVGGAPLDKFEQVDHRLPMLSLENGFSALDLAEFADKLERFLNEPVTGGYSAEPKLDGLAVELIYREGLFTLGSTRGDGLTGENVSAQATEAFQGTHPSAEQPSSRNRRKQAHSLGVARREAERGKPDPLPRAHVCDTSSVAGWHRRKARDEAAATRAGRDQRRARSQVRSNRAL